MDAIGTAAVGASEPIRPDAIFRITSMTRPVTAVAALQLVDEGTLALDEPVDRLLPELAGRPVLRQWDGPVDDAVAADRPVTVRDLLTFRAGFGMILAPPSEYPILEAEQALELRSVGPPTPVTPHGPDEWLRRMGTLPLMDQPGTQWRYNTSSQILGVLISRAAGQPVDSFYRERIFDPLGMHDTGFRALPAQLSRSTVLPGGRRGTEPFDDDGQWSRPRVFADCGAGLLSTASDYLAFGQMLLADGVHRGERILAPELVAAMTADQLTPRQRDAAGLSSTAADGASASLSSTRPSSRAEVRRDTAGTAASALRGPTTPRRTSSRSCAPKCSPRREARRWKPTSGRPHTRRSTINNPPQQLPSGRFTSRHPPTSRRADRSIRASRGSPTRKEPTRTDRRIGRLSQGPPSGPDRAGCSLPGRPDGARQVSIRREAVGRREDS